MEMQSQAEILYDIAVMESFFNFNTQNQDEDLMVASFKMLGSPMHGVEDLMSKAKRSTRSRLR